MKVLITGASGMLGSAITAALLKQGHEVAILSRSPRNIANVQSFVFDLNTLSLPPECIDGVDMIIHLAGASIDGSWSEQGKKEIVNSRVLPLELLKKLLLSKAHQVRKIISASGVGYYGGDNGDSLLSEANSAGGDFLAQICLRWEQAVKELADAAAIDYCIYRTAVVLDKEHGALPKIAFPVKFYAGAPLGSGRQYFPWVHIDDVAKAYLYAINNPIAGAYNLVAPQLITNKQLMKALGKVLHKPILPIAVPAFVLRLMLKEKSILVLGSAKVSSQQLSDTGFSFQYDDIVQTLSHIYAP